MIDHSQTDPTALQGPQNRAQRSVQWITTDPKTGMTLDEMAALVQNVMRADTAVLESLLTGVGHADQGHRGIPQPGADGEDRGGTMSELDIEEIRARVAQATPAPWSSHVLPQQVGLNRASLHSPNGPQETAWTTSLDPEIGGVGTVPDAVLIAHAPADLTALCDEVEHLRAERDLMREEISLSAMKTTKTHAEAEGDLEADRVAKTVVGTVRFDVTIRRFDGEEIDAGMLTAPLRAGEKDGKLQVEPLDLREAFAEALDIAEETQVYPSAMATDGTDVVRPQRLRDAQNRA